MHSLLDRLDEICKQHLFDEKILVIDSHQIGEEIYLNLAKSGYTAINLKLKTVRELALDIIHQFLTERLEIINDTIGTHFISTIFRHLKESDALTYFDKLETTPSLSHALFQTIKTLRLAGFNTSSINKAHFISNEKYEDVKKLLTEYERLLANYSVLDDALLYERAYKLIAKAYSKDPIFIIQPGLTLQFIEEKFLSRLIEGHYEKLPFAPIYGVSIPERSSFSARLQGRATPLSNLYQLDDKYDEPNLSLFVTKTEELELKEVLFKIKEQKIVFDETAIFYTTQEPYNTIMYHLSEKLNIPVTFGEGIPITYTKPGKLVYSFLNWIRHSYHVEAFLAILQEGVIELGDGAPSKLRIASLLRKAKIGWGRDRYLPHLQKEIDLLKEKRDNEIESEGQAYFEKQLHDYQWLSKWFTALFKKLPNLDQPSIEYASLVNALEFVLTKFAKATSRLDFAAKATLIDEIALITPYMNGFLTSYEAFQTIEEFLLTLKVGVSGPMPGAIHITSYLQGCFINRTHTFVVGLDNQRFPGILHEDPLLLDIERTHLGNQLMTTENEGKEKIIAMLQLLAATTGEVSVSYCQFSMNENRKLNPSHLFLQCYRMKSGESNADYRQLETKFTPSLQGNLIEEKDWWTHWFIVNGAKKFSSTLLDRFQNIKQGLYARTQRNLPEFSIYDGKIESDTSLLDPRINQDITITAGKLEKLAKCPFAYFFEEVLGIKPIEELAYDPTKWLEPHVRGSLLHEVFEKFYKNLQERNQKPCYQDHEDLILGIAGKVIHEYKEQIPPPSVRVFELEKEELLQSCLLFLKAEEEYCLDASPFEFEYMFGIGEVPPAVIGLPSGTINISGKVDRVDKTPGDMLHIIDYKTGSTYHYDQNKPYQGGRQLQHMLYALAIENRLQLKQGSVLKSSYLFPTIKGQGVQYARIQNDEMRTNGLEIIERLLDLLKLGHFPMSDNSDDCKYCSVCQRSFYREDTIKMKLTDENVEGVKRFKGVRAYD